MADTVQMCPPSGVEVFDHTINVIERIDGVATCPMCGTKVKMGPAQNHQMLKYGPHPMPKKP